MSKKQKKDLKTKTQKETTAGKFDFGKFIPHKYQIPLALLIVLLLLAIFFAPIYFSDQTIQSGDIITQSSFKNFDRDENSLWNPYIFCGMPMFGNAGWYDIANQVINVVRTGYGNLWRNTYAGFTVYLLLLAYGSFFFMRRQKANIGISLFVAISTIFSLGIISLLFEGHINKMTTLTVFPLILLMIFKMQEKIKLLDVLILMLAVKFMFSQWHVQIIFYIYFSLAVYFIYYLIYAAVNKYRELRNRLISVMGILLIVTAAGFAMHYYYLGQMYEYTPYSTRGTKSILDLESQAAAHSDEKLYDYNTDWSFSPGEVMTFIFPSYYGFGNSTYNGPLTKNQDYPVNTYFGQMPFTHAAMYMGIIIFALALFAVFSDWRNPIVQFLTILLAIALITSFGRNLPLIYDLMYKFVPFFQKFRAPSMFLVVLQVCLPILAGIGLVKIISIKNNRELKFENPLRNIALVFTAFLIISLVLGSTISEWFINRIPAGGQKADYFKALSPYMGDMFVSDARIAFALLALLFFLLFSFIKNKISTDLLMGSLIVLTLFDIWRIDFRALDFVKEQDIDGLFQKPQYINAIEQENDRQPFRLVNIKQDNSLGSLRQNSNYYVYFLMEDFYGYSALKPRSYQDFMDITGPANPTLWRMLNVKYVITEKPLEYPGFKTLFTGEKNALNLNTSALPRAYFVDTVAVSPAINFINMVKNNQFDPKHVAYLEQNIEIPIDQPDSTASVSITEYGELGMTIEATASGNNFLFVGNTYYPLGWKAKVDGEKADIVKTNHGFMGLVIPKGNHKIEFYYSPDTFVMGKNLTLILNIGMLVLLGFIVIRYKKK